MPAARRSRGFLSANAKALAALVSSAIVLVAAWQGLNLPPGVVESLTAVITGAVVWTVRNGAGGQPTPRARVKRRVARRARREPPPATLEGGGPRERP
jgi:hypothetical protein